MNAKTSFFGLAVSAALASVALQAGAATIVVPGTSDPWLAGMPAGSTASSGDTAPGQSPVLVPFSVAGGDLLRWTASGTVDHPGDAADPDGKPGLLNVSHSNGAENGISDITVPIDSLIAVFLGPGQPDLNPAPGALDFSTAAARNYLTLAPSLQQVFFLGDGQTDSSQIQTIIAPAGATRLYLGTMDGFGWYNNGGSFEVNIGKVGASVPDAASGLGLLSFSLMSLLALRRRVG